ncbi:MAG: bifunctional diaminohydroxyphosphoribosylaminopyrimidine deaminase/5-amino-6-(5-phosphoribosylamino)uracil reductase RibD [Chloroflexota bacterium]|nr:bifunctional diaminohydroxyphosphoribosylaminopyrimidine deaminase/5-amino-6-(5-phosphoribosylamino)uracil reductase RibD [Chloroflexota bacterium]MEE2655969.1 bifunctional diaminohydroxyphosphoribosylaminopyrimidine deaminase/5-amino-6-(5-phosphoribosylamino)uracil reductase RibD [Chloroflexota bacterium]
MQHMQRAIELARKTLGSTSPNPPVGAVIVNDGIVVGEGCTQPAGGPHAEIIALECAGEAARGAIIYTTLEPCCHVGRTPPCTAALMEAGIIEVRTAILDPDPRVNGRGIAAMENAGIKVSLGLCAEDATEIIESYIHRTTTGSPFLIAKFAMSMDGKIATSTGESQWISGDAARQHVHALRRSVDAVMVGVGTVLVDDPQLTTRDEKNQPLPRQPLRVVVDSSGRVKPRSKLFAGPGKVLVATADVNDVTEASLLEVGAEVVRFPGGDGRVDLSALMVFLAERGVNSVLIEAGGTLLASLIQHGLVSKVEAIIAPMLIGGRAALTPVEGDGVSRLQDALRLENVTVGRLGNDIHIVGYPTFGHKEGT